MKRRQNPSRLSLRLRVRAIWWQVTALVRYWQIALCLVAYVAFPWVVSHFPGEGCFFRQLHHTCT